jgi:hypothetical protein
MRRFQDEEGAIWIASARERPGDDYKGRYFLVMAKEDENPEKELELAEVRWNSMKTAERTLQTMSRLELERRRRSASGRAR